VTNACAHCTSYTETSGLREERQADNNVLLVLHGGGSVRRLPIACMMPDTQTFFPFSIYRRGIPVLENLEIEEPQRANQAW
jgi:hypothetical protein